jgi:hypothetical protein
MRVSKEEERRECSRFYDLLWQGRGGDLVNMIHLEEENFCLI